MAKAKKTAKKKSSVKKPPARKKPVKKKAVKKNPAKKVVAKKVISKKTLPKPVAKKVPAKKPVVKAVAKPAVKGITLPPTRLKKGPSGLPEQLLDAALKVLDERQAEDIFIADLAGKSSMADYLIVASGRAARQITAIAHYLREAFEKLGVKQMRIEGMHDANWVLVDAGDVIIHLFRPEVRRYYDLERMWDGGDVERAALIRE